MSLRPPGVEARIDGRYSLSHVGRRAALLVEVASPGPGGDELRTEGQAEGEAGTAGARSARRPQGLRLRRLARAGARLEACWPWGGGSSRLEGCWPEEGWSYRIKRGVGRNTLSNACIRLRSQNRTRNNGSS